MLLLETYPHELSPTPCLLQLARDMEHASYIYVSHLVAYPYCVSAYFYIMSDGWIVKKKNYFVNLILCVGI